MTTTITVVASQIAGPLEAAIICCEQAVTAAGQRGSFAAMLRCVKSYLEEALAAVVAEDSGQSWQTALGKLDAGSYLLMMAAVPGDPAVVDEVMTAEDQIAAARQVIRGWCEADQAARTAKGVLDAALRLHTALAEAGAAASALSRVLLLRGEDSADELSDLAESIDQVLTAGQLQQLLHDHTGAEHTPAS